MVTQIARPQKANQTMSQDVNDAANTDRLARLDERESIGPFNQECATDKNSLVAQLEIPGIDSLDVLRNRIGLVSRSAVLSLAIGAIAVLLAIVLGIDAMTPETFDLPGKVIGQVYIHSNAPSANTPFAPVFLHVKDLIGGPLTKILGGMMILTGLVSGLTRQSLMSFFMSFSMALMLFNMPTILDVLLEGAGAPAEQVQVLSTDQPPYVLAQQLVKGGSPDRARAYVDELVGNSYQGVKDFNPQVATALEIAVYQAARSPVAIATVQAAADSDANSERMALFSGTLGAMLFLICMAATTLRRNLVNNVESIDNDIAYLLQMNPAKQGV